MYFLNNTLCMSCLKRSCCRLIWNDLSSSLGSFSSTPVFLLKCRLWITGTINQSASPFISNVWLDVFLKFAFILNVRIVMSWFGGYVFTLPKNSIRQRCSDPYWLLFTLGGRLRYSYNLRTWWDCLWLTCFAMKYGAQVVATLLITGEKQNERFPASRSTMALSAKRYCLLDIRHFFMSSHAPALDPSVLWELGHSSSNQNSFSNATAGWRAPKLLATTKPTSILDQALKKMNKSLKVLKLITAGLQRSTESAAVGWDGFLQSNLPRLLSSAQQLGNRAEQQGL